MYDISMLVVFVASSLLVLLLVLLYCLGAGRPDQARRQVREAFSRGKILHTVNSNSQSHSNGVYSSHSNRNTGRLLLLLFLVGEAFSRGKTLQTRNRESENPLKSATEDLLDNCSKHPLDKPDDKSVVCVCVCVCES